MPSRADVVLVPHEGSRPAAVRRLAARAGWERVDRLSVAFSLEAGLQALRVPPPRRPAFVNGLWRHTCFEVFVSTGPGPDYHEWNLSPSGEWAVHAFRSYRDGDPVHDERLAPAIAVRTGDECLELDAVIPLGALPPEIAGGPLRLGLSAVIEAADGSLSWWALRHPGGEPDFHHPDAFALRLEPPGT